MLRSEKNMYFHLRIHLCLPVQAQVPKVHQAFFSPSHSNQGAEGAARAEATSGKSFSLERLRHGFLQRLHLDRLFSFFMTTCKGG